MKNIWKVGKLLGLPVGNSNACPGDEVGKMLELRFRLSALHGTPLRPRHRLWFVMSLNVELLTNVHAHFKNR